MGRPDIPGFDKAQWQHDNQEPEDFDESEDDIPGAMEDIIEEEKEEEHFWRKYGERS